MSQRNRMQSDRRRASGRLWKPGGRVFASPMQMVRLLAELAPRAWADRIECEFQEMAEVTCEVNVVDPLERRP